MKYSEVPKPAKPGEYIQASYWISEEAERDFAMKSIIDAIDLKCSEDSLIHGPIFFIEKHPMDDIPDAPDHIQGQLVRLIIGETQVFAAPTVSRGSFVANLDEGDLKKLKEATKRAYPGISDQECIEAIEFFGTQTAEEDVLRAVRDGAVH